MDDDEKTLACPKCQFGNPPDAVTCTYCKEDLPFAQETRRISRKYARQALAAAKAAQAMLVESAEAVEQSAELLPTPSSALLDATSADDGSEVLAWLACRPLAPLPLGARPTLSLGRGADCDVVLPHTEVSRHHAVLKIRRGSILIEDEGSSNGTLLNDKRVTSAQVRVGDTITVGPYVLELITEQEAQAEAAHAKGATGLVLKGDLREVSAPELLQNIEFNKWTGVLQVVDRKGRRGELCFVSGSLIRAEFAGHEGEEAVLGLVLLDAGRFSFSRRPMTGGGKPYNLTRILLDASRVQDEGELPEWIRDGVDLESGAYGALLQSGEDQANAPSSRDDALAVVASASDAPEARAGAIEPALALEAPAPSAPGPSRSWSGLALILLLPLLVVVPLATLSYKNAFLETLAKQRSQRIDRQLVRTLQATHPITQDVALLTELRDRLEGLGKDAPEHDLGASPRHLAVLEGILALARGDRRRAEELARRPEVLEQDTAAAALRGALAASVATGPSAQALEDLTYALERGVRRREMREWRVRVCDLSQEAQARVALADLGELSALGGGLSPAQEELKVRALLALGADYVPAAATVLEELKAPSPALTWSVVTAQAEYDLAGGDPAAAAARLRALKDSPPPDVGQELLAQARSEGRALLEVEPTVRSDDDLARLVELLTIERRLGGPLPDEVLDGLFAWLASPARPMSCFVAAVELLAADPLPVRRRLLVALYTALESPEKVPRSRFSFHVVMCSVLSVDAGRLGGVGSLVERLEDPTARAELYLARGRARERLGRISLGVRDLIKAKRLSPDLDVVDDLDRMRKALRERGG